MSPRILAVAALVLLANGSIARPQSLPGFQKSSPFDEQVRWTRLDSGVRVFVNAPATMTAKPRVLVVFATPNGNTIEQTLGCSAAKERDWRFDIQHVAAQMRRLREIDRDREFVLAVVQAPKLSWPTFRREQAGAKAIHHPLRRSKRPAVRADDFLAVERDFAIVIRDDGQTPNRVCLQPRQQFVAVMFIVGVRVVGIEKHDPFER